MIRTNQIIAAATVTAIIVTTMIFAYGQSIVTLEQYFSFSLASLAAKVALSAAMLIIVFFARPRSYFNRTIVGIAGVSVLGYATFGALAGTLPLGDAIIFFAGTLIAMTESVEATMPRRKPAAAPAVVEAEPALPSKA